MFSMFSLRRPNILPCGDLGVQKGLLRWVLASHSPEEAAKVRIAPHRLPGNADEEAAAEAAGSLSKEFQSETQPQADNLVASTISEEVVTSLIPAPSNSMNPPATPAKKSAGKGSRSPTKAPPPSPFSSAVFTKRTGDEGTSPVPLPTGLNVPTLKARLGGKKTK